MDNEEVEFIAENELITVIPNFQYKTLYLIGVCEFFSVETEMFHNKGRRYTS